MDGKTEKGTVTYAYDNDGALARVMDSETGITTTYYYDFTDRMMKYVETGTNYTHSVGYEYDTLNNLTQLVETINGVEHTSSYTYDEDNRIMTSATDGITAEYAYDDFGRVTTQTTKNGSAVVLTESYTYTAPASTTTSAQIATYTTTTPNGYSITYTYTYDDNGNITSVFDGTNTTTYHYDSANQLYREDNQAGGFTHTWTYDNAGNIIKRLRTAYTADALTSLSSDANYIYGDSQWGDLLTGYNGKTFTYDAIGNLTSDGTWTYTWENGRELASMTNGSTTWTYIYDANGMRTSRRNGSATCNYVYNGAQLTRMTPGSHVLDFTYDANGTPLTVTWNGTTYYYVTNLQGDVTAILDSTGTMVVSYKYDAWGNILSMSGSLLGSLGSLNPLRYRGYVFDEETGLYYLQSRYYNPEMGRFINADGLISTGQGTLSHNMFAYCSNNPVNKSDSTGLAAVEIGKIIAKTIIGGVISASCQLIAGGSLEEVAIAFGQGLVSGFVSSLGTYFTIGIIVYDVAATIIDCYNSGVSLKGSLLTGALELVSSLVYVSDCDLLTECLFDLTFGFAASLIPSVVAEVIKPDEKLQQNLPGNSMPSYPETTTYTPPVPASKDNYRPSYSGAGWSFVGLTHGNHLRIPTVPCPARPF